MNRTGFTSSEWDREKRNDGMEVYETVSGQSPSGHAKQRVKLSTLGCRLNQYESQAIREQFLRAGYMETRDSKEADVFVHDIQLSPMAAYLCVYSSYNFNNVAARIPLS